MTSPCIFVTGVWKSGNHLAYSALNALGVPGPFNGIAAHLLFGRHSWAKRVVRGALPLGNSIQVGLEADAYVRDRYISGQIRRLAGKIMGGHAAYSHELMKLLKEENARIVCIRRDPRDILVSFADWIPSRPDYFLYPGFASLTSEERVRLLLRGGDIKGITLLPFSEVLRRAEGWLSVEGVLQVSFEDLIGPAGGGDAVRQSRALSALKDHSGATKLLDDVDVGAIYGRSLTFNKGRSQRWREIDDPELRQEIDDVTGPSLATWGYLK